jgi:hypothetical protein
MAKTTSILLQFFLCFVKDLRGINSQNKQNNFLSFFCQRLEKYSAMLCADKKEEKSATSSPTRTRVRENEERTVKEKKCDKGYSNHCNIRRSCCKGGSNNTRITFIKKEEEICQGQQFLLH